MRQTKKRKFSIATSVLGSEATLALSGPLNAAASAVLGPECVELFDADYRLALDLAKVSSVDNMGLQVLTGLWKLGATLTNVPDKIAQKIDTAKYETRWSWH